MVAAPGRFIAVDEVLERARGLVERYEAETRALVPEGAKLFDAHVHVGRDIDGMVAPFEELADFLRRWGVERAFAFCLDEPDREPAFRAANDRTLAAAERSDGPPRPLRPPRPGGAGRSRRRRACLDLGRARDQAPSAGAGLPAERPAARAGVRARRRAAGSDPHPRRARPAADRRAPPQAPRRLPGGLADHRPRRDRRPRRALRVLRRAAARLLRHLGLERDRPPGHVRAASRPGRCCTHRTTRTASSPAPCCSPCGRRCVAGLSEEEVRDMLGRSAARIADGERPHAARRSRAVRAASTSR